MTYGRSQLEPGPHIHSKQWALPCRSNRETTVQRRRTAFPRVGLYLACKRRLERTATKAKEGFSFDLRADPSTVTLTDPHRFFVRPTDLLGLAGLERITIGQLF